MSFEELINKILTDMIDSGELKLGLFVSVKEFELEYFKLIQNGVLFEGSVKCDIKYFESGKEFIKAMLIPKDVLDRYMLQNNRDNLINDLIK